uniref:Uncharacterized protein n=1 Tax=Pyramimonas obovata TaxID=1411642 RepID=A0A7S0RCX6_9CHLO|mmetsp:Transcript_30979/g.67682  ORF Transcript_30979/g.67682 Transcript_30979/m.67682 type:complete len:413 (+) Transcript_30979:443-1681(+)|eukprot:CAMPEP_0118924440 /NCGR_PEP_ID=MMETSP1169-20130426/2578_1 /TAXON_ID=36882 /ORGANISM="Pyramimonas obovata, Strain CCMP722" /LENGTH=412 /DNA_ID=CAMNT_0006865557 /DNA_START=440 /DNA_END=1678 /DNA_ORIENTATION=+
MLEPLKRFLTIRELEYLLVSFWIATQIGEAQAQVWVEMPCVTVAMLIAVALTYLSWNLSTAEFLHEVSLCAWVLGNMIWGIGLLYDVRTGGNIAPESDETDEYEYYRHFGMGLLSVAVLVGIWSFALGVIEVRQSNGKTLKEMWKERSLFSFWFGKKTERTPLISADKQVDADAKAPNYQTQEEKPGGDLEKEEMITGYGNTMKKGEFHVMQDLPAFQQPLPMIFANWREYDNIHSLFWAMLDLVWNIEGSIFGIKYGAFYLWTIIIFFTMWISIDFVIRSHVGYYRENVYYWSVFLWLAWNAAWQLGELAPSDVLVDHTYYWPMGSHPNSFWNMRWWASWGLLGALIPITVTELHYIIWRHNWRTQKAGAATTTAGKVVLLEDPAEPNPEQMSREKFEQKGYIEPMIQRDF